MPKKLLATIIIIATILTLGLLQVVEVDANPVPWASTPNLEKPTLTIQSPQNNTKYNNSIVVNFTVIKPESWNSVHMFSYYVGGIDSVNVSLDGNQVSYDNIGSSYFVNLNLSSSGPHSLNITVLSYTYYEGEIYDNSSTASPIYDAITINGVTTVNTIYEYPIVVSDIVNFTVQQPEDQLSVLPNQTNLILIATVIVIVAVVSVSLVYFGEREVNNEEKDSSFCTHTSNICIDWSIAHWEVEANPYLLYRQVTPGPNTIPPKITISNLQNGTESSSDLVIVHLNVVKPQLTDHWSGITSIKFSVDGSDKTTIYSKRWTEIVDMKSTNTNEISTDFYLPPLAKGNHTLTIQAQGAVVPKPGLEYFYVNSTSTTTFTVLNQTVVYYIFANLFLITLIGIITVFVAVLVSWKYVKRRKKLTSKQSFL